MLRSPGSSFLWTLCSEELIRRLYTPMHPTTKARGRQLSPGNLEYSGTSRSPPKSCAFGAIPTSKKDWTRTTRSTPDQALLIAFLGISGRRLPCAGSPLSVFGFSNQDYGLGVPAYASGVPAYVRNCLSSVFFQGVGLHLTVRHLQIAGCGTWWKMSHFLKGGMCLDSCPLAEKS